MLKYSDLTSKKQYMYEVIIPALHKAGYEEKALKLSYCSVFKTIAVCQDCGTKLFNGATSCKDRFCVICEKKRTMLWVLKLKSVVEELLDEGYYLNLITLTIPDTDNLEEELTTLNNCWRYVSHQNRYIAKAFKERFIGGIRSLEVKRGAIQGKWHAHYHIIVVKDKFSKDFEFLKDVWLRAYNSVTKNKIESVNVFINSFKYKSRENIIKNLLEACKYITKFNWQLADDVEELVKNLTGKRSINTWGLMREKLKLEQIEYEMNRPYTEIEKQYCSECGSSDFEIFEGVTHTGALKDFKDMEEK